MNRSVYFYQSPLGTSTVELILIRAFFRHSVFVTVLHSK